MAWKKEEAVFTRRLTRAEEREQSEGRVIEGLVSLPATIQLGVEARKKMEHPEARLAVCRCGWYGARFPEEGIVCEHCSAEVKLLARPFERERKVWVECERCFGGGYKCRNCGGTGGWWVGESAYREMQAVREAAAERRRQREAHRQLVGQGSRRLAKKMQATDEKKAKVEKFEAPDGMVEALNAKGESVAVPAELATDNVCPVCGLKHYFRWHTRLVEFEGKLSPVHKACMEKHLPGEVAATALSFPDRRAHRQSKLEEADRFAEFLTTLAPLKEREKQAAEAKAKADAEAKAKAEADAKAKEGDAKVPKEKKDKKAAKAADEPNGEEGPQGPSLVDLQRAAEMTRAYMLTYARISWLQGQGKPSAADKAELKRLEKVFANQYDEAQRFCDRDKERFDAIAKEVQFSHAEDINAVRAGGEFSL